MKPFEIKHVGSQSWFWNGATLGVFLSGDSSIWFLEGLAAETAKEIFEGPNLLRELADQVSRVSLSGDENSNALKKYKNTKKTTISALNLNLTDKCNLACVYCYAKGGNYDRIHQNMSVETACWGLENALKKSDSTREFRIEFFGGEPLFNLETIDGVLKWQGESKLWKNHSGGTVNRISTNLSVLEPGAIEALIKGVPIVSISLDGIAHIQDGQRPFKNGRGSFDTIMGNIRRLRAAAPEAIMVARMTVFQYDSELFSSVHELVQTDLFDYVSIYPASLFASKNQEQGKTHFSEVFRKEFLRMAEAYPHMVGKGRFKGCLELNRYCEAILTGKTVLNHCRAGSGYFTLSPDRSVHPCHRLVGDTTWNLGAFDLNEDPFLLKLKPWHVTVEERPMCLECQLRFLCGGGCKQQQLVATGDMLGNDSRVCAFSELLFASAVTVVDGVRAVGSPETSDSPFVSVLKKSFQELSRLFVFCGQPVEGNRRMVRKTGLKLAWQGKGIIFSPVCWEK